MNESSAIIIAAIFGPVAALFISEFFRYLRAKNEREDRFFYEIYPKRLELYEEILKEVYPAEMAADMARNLSAPALKEKLERINRLVLRGVIYGQSAVTDALTELACIYDLLFKRLESGAHPLDERFHLSIERLPVLCKMILEFIREESGKYVVDKKIFQFFKEFKAELDKSEKNPGYRRNPNNDKYNLYRHRHKH